MTARISVVDDQPELAELLHVVLEAEGHLVTAVHVRERRFGITSLAGHRNSGVHPERARVEPSGVRIVVHTMTVTDTTSRERQTGRVARPGGATNPDQGP